MPTPTHNYLSIPSGTKDIALGGTHSIVCVHGRKKRSHTIALPKPGFHTQICHCCENIFVTDTDVPKPCHTCTPNTTRTTRTTRTTLRRV